MRVHVHVCVSTHMCKAIIVERGCFSEGFFLVSVLEVVVREEGEMSFPG